MALFIGLHFQFAQNRFWGEVWSSASHNPQKAKKSQCTCTVLLVACVKSASCMCRMLLFVVCSALFFHPTVYFQMFPLVGAVLKF